MRRMKKNLILTVAFLIIMGPLHLGGDQVLAAGPKGTLKIANHWTISRDWIDPSTSTSGTSAPLPLYFYHDALLKVMPEGRYTPCVAESWTVSPDYKVYEFKIRKGVKFHNGDEVTAEDVVFTFQRYKAVSAKLIQGRIQKLEAVNPYVFRVTFKEPFVDFLDYFLPGMGSIGFVVPKKYIEQVGDEGYKRHPIGCGPYKFVEFKPGVRFVGEAFEDFWRKVPKVKRIEYYMVKSRETRYAMLKTGEADYVTRTDGVFYEKVKKDQGLRVFTPLSLSHWVIFPTAQWDPKSPWSDVRVRKAASLALDRKMLAEIFCPGTGPLGTLGLPGFPNNLERPADPYDPEGAKKLLAEAGYPNGFHGGKFYPFPGLSWWAMGELMANYWKAVGITVESVKLGRPDYKSKRRYGKFKDAVFYESVSQPTVAGRLGYVIGGLTYVYGNYPDIEALWDRYNKSIDPKVRKDLLLQIQKLINEKVMFIYTIGSSSPSALGPRMKGNPFKLSGMLWWATPMEDFELDE